MYMYLVIVSAVTQPPDSREKSGRSVPPPARLTRKGVLEIITQSPSRKPPAARASLYHRTLYQTERPAGDPHGPGAGRRAPPGQTSHGRAASRPPPGRG